MDTYMHKTMASVVSLEKIEIIRSQEFMPSEARLKFLKKKEIILGPKTAILGPQFCRILVLGPHFWWSGGPLGPPWICPCWARASKMVCPVISTRSTWFPLLTFPIFSLSFTSNSPCNLDVLWHYSHTFCMNC